MPRFVCGEDWQAASSFVGKKFKVRVKAGATVRSGPELSIHRAAIKPGRREGLQEDGASMPTLQKRSKTGFVSPNAAKTIEDVVSPNSARRFL